MSKRQRVQTEMREDTVVAYWGLLRLTQEVDFQHTPLCSLAAVIAAEQRGYFFDLPDVSTAVGQATAPVTIGKKGAVAGFR